MELTDFMAENHTKVFTGYDHQSNIALLSALLLGWKRLENQHKMVDNMKQQPNYLINCVFNLIDELDPPVIRGYDKNYNSFALLDKFSELHKRQVVVLESPMNDAMCALESLEDVPFQVHYSTPVVYGRKRPIVLWETHLVDDLENDRVHYHTIVDDSLNIDQALMDAGFYTYFDIHDYAALEKFALAKYEFDELPEAFHHITNDETIPEWVDRIDRRRGPYTWETGEPVPVEPVSLKDIVVALDEWSDIIRRTKADDAARKASIKSGDYSRRFDHISKDIDPSEYTYGMRVHASYCKACPV